MILVDVAPSESSCARTENPERGQVAAVDSAPRRASPRPPRPRPAPRAHVVGVHQQGRPVAEGGQLGDERVVLAVVHQRERVRRRARRRDPVHVAARRGSTWTRTRRCTRPAPPPRPPPRACAATPSRSAALGRRRGGHHPGGGRRDRAVVVQDRQQRRSPAGPTPRTCPPRRGSGTRGSTCRPLRSPRCSPRTGKMPGTERGIVHDARIPQKLQFAWPEAKLLQRVEQPPGAGHDAVPAAVRQVPREHLEHCAARKRRRCAGRPAAW